MIAQLNKRYWKASAAKGLVRLVSYAFFEGRPLTTRGRWINPLVFFVYAVAKRLPISCQDKKPIFILGTGRSGTTILGIVLSLHPDIGFLNEPKALWHALYPLEDVIGSYSKGPARYILTEEHVTNEMILSARRVHCVYTKVTRSRRVLDKYPELVFRVPFVSKLFPDAKYLFLVRNGWDACQSIEQWSIRHGNQGASVSKDWWGVDDRKWKFLVAQVASREPMFTGHLDALTGITAHRDRATLEWVLSMREGLRLVSTMPDKVLMIRYEDLASRPGETVKTIMDHAELKYDQRTIEYALASLRPVRAKGTFAMHPILEPLFMETMRDLGYYA